MRELNLDLVRVTEGAAIAAYEWVGTGEKELADKAATDAIRERLNKLRFSGTVVIGEGEKDKSYGLFNGERVGLLSDYTGLTSYDICLDPIEGTRPTVTSGPEALSVVAIAEPGSMMPIQEHYALKLAYGPEIARAKRSINIVHPLDENVKIASMILQKPLNRMVVCILDRPRHKAAIELLRSMGVRIKLIQDCDVSGALATCLPESGVDLLYGVGGAPEAVITACAMKCLKGGIQIQISDKDGNVAERAPFYETRDLVKGNCIFAATGITNGSLLDGVRFTSRGAVTHSVFMRSESGTVRWLTTEHGN